VIQFKRNQELSAEPKVVKELVECDPGIWKEPIIARLKGSGTAIKSK